MPTHTLFLMLEDAITYGGPANLSVGERLLLATWWLLDRTRDEFDIGYDDAIELFVELAAYAHAEREATDGH